MPGLIVAFEYFICGVCFFPGAIIISLLAFRIALTRQENKSQAIISTKNNITATSVALIKRKGRDTAIMSAILVFFVIVLGVPAIFKTVSFVKQGGWNGFSESDVSGIWTASYEEYGCWRFTGKEILTLNNDGTYEQAFIDAVGTRQQVAQGKWELTEYQEHQVVLFERAKELPYYEFIDDDCDNIPEKPLLYLSTQQSPGKRLRIRTELFATDKVFLETSAGDPDAPTITTFYRSE